MLRLVVDNGLTYNTRRYCRAFPTFLRQARLHRPERLNSAPSAPHAVFSACAPEETLRDPRRLSRRGRPPQHRCCVAHRPAPTPHPRAPGNRYLRPSLTAEKSATAWYGSSTVSLTERHHQPRPPCFGRMPWPQRQNQSPTPRQAQYCRRCIRSAFGSARHQTPVGLAALPRAYLGGLVTARRVARRYRPANKGETRCHLRCSLGPLLPTS